MKRETQRTTLAASSVMTGAEGMAACLLRESVSIVFGYPGAAICPFYDALSKTKIRHVLARQEQNAGHAANGYARISGRPGVCVTTSGPGALNLLPAIAAAYADSVPLVAITGQVSGSSIGKDVFQEADITGAAEPFVKHSYLIKDIRDIPRVFREAFYIASTGRKGPVLIDVPVNLQKESFPFTYPETVSVRGYHPNLTVSESQIKKVFDALAKAKRPLICVGGGVVSADAGSAVTVFSQKTGIPLVTTMMGISALSPQYERNLGMVGLHGHVGANRAVREADLLFMIGARLGDRATMGWHHSGQTLIHLDIDPAEIGKNMPAHIALTGDAKTVLEEMNQYCPDLSYTNPADPTYMEKESPAAYRNVDPHRLMEILCEQAQRDAVFSVDVGQHQIWAAQGYRLQNGRFLTSGGMGTMGYSIPAAIGAHLADPSRQTIVLCGDGGFQMSMMELAVIKENHLPIKMILLNNNSLGLVREIQDHEFAGNRMAVSLENPDFISLANAFGIPAERVSDNEILLPAIQAFLSQDGSYLLECVIDPERPTLNKLTMDN